MGKLKTPRWGWALTGSGHFFKECLRMIGDLDEVDLFVSKAASEVVRMYRQDAASCRRPPASSATRRRAPRRSDCSTTASITRLIMAPATSNTVAKCVFGISDTLVTNVFAQAGKCRVPTIVFACDTAPELETEAPKGMVKVYPRDIDLQNTERLKSFESTTVVETLEQLETALTTPQTRTAWLSASSFSPAISRARGWKRSSPRPAISVSTGRWSTSA